MLSDGDRPAGPPSSDETGVGITPQVLLRMARGFSCFFWGLPVGLLFLSGVLTLNLSSRLRIPAHIVAVLIVYAGILLLRRAGPVTPTWMRRVRLSLLLLLIELYLTPFIFWWRHMPYQPYYTINVVILILCTAWQICLLNLFASDVGRILRDKVFRVEAGITAWTSLVLMLIPAANAILLSFALRIRPGGFLIVDTSLLPFGLPRWMAGMSVLALLPFTLTMAIAWKAKERCLQLITASAGANAAGEFEA